MNTVRGQRNRIGLVLLLAVIGSCAWLTFSAWQGDVASHRLISALKTRNTTSTLEALEEGADPNAREEPQSQPMGLRTWLVRLWQRATQAQSEQQPTALGLAITYSGDFTVIKALLDRGADTNAECGGLFGGEPLSPLTLAACGNDAKVVNLLLDHHANINAQNKSGQTALMVAAEDGSLDIVTCLLNRGAREDIKDKTGKIVLDRMDGECRMYCADIQDALLTAHVRRK